MKWNKKNDWIFLVIGIISLILVLHLCSDYNSNEKIYIPEEDIANKLDSERNSELIKNKTIHLDSLRSNANHR